MSVYRLYILYAENPKDPTKKKKIIKANKWIQ